MKCCQVFFTKKSFTQKINRKRTKILMKAVWHISCPRLLSHVSCPKSPVSCLLSHSPVSCLTSPVSRLLSHAPCLKSPVSRLLSHVSCLKSPVLHLVYLFKYKIIRELVVQFVEQREVKTEVMGSSPEWCIFFPSV